jgi:hypothetical protein
VKLITAVARYNEDLEWVESLNTDVVIYNKGDSFDFVMPRTDVPNIEENLKLTVDLSY